MRLDGCIKVEQKQIRVVKPLPERLSYFKPLYDFLYEKSPIKIIKMLDAYNISLTDKKFQELFCSLGDSLCEKEACCHGNHDNGSDDPVITCRRNNDCDKHSI